MSASLNGSAGALRGILENACQAGISMGKLTVLATQNDPYRVDTPAGHRDAAWFQEQFNRAGRSRIHLRGLHYAIVARGDVLKPNGQPYINSDADWTWLQMFPAKSGRWLGYVPFDAVTDERNTPPVIHRKDRVEPRSSIEMDAEIYLPDLDDLEPKVAVSGFEGRQLCHLVIFGEKSSLSEVILPIARRFDADLYLPTGEISDTLLHKMAADAAADGRPMQVFTLSDCDPSGYQMPVSIGRKLQALRDLKFANLDFEVRPIALTVDQVRELGLPSTPLKETERRADRWREAFSVEQTEIDALATLQPRVLDRIIREAIQPFYDLSLAGRVFEAKDEWKAAAQEVFDATVDQEMLQALRDQAAEKLEDLREQIRTITEGIPTAGMIVLPDFDIPNPEPIDPALYRKPLISSAWSWVDQTRALIDRKRYAEAPS